MARGVGLWIGMLFCCARCSSCCQTDSVDCSLSASDDESSAFCSSRLFPLLEDESTSGPGPVLFDSESEDSCGHGPVLFDSESEDSCCCSCCMLYSVRLFVASPVSFGSVAVVESC